MNDKVDKSSSIFINGITQKMKKVDKDSNPLIMNIKYSKAKKWELK